MLFETDGLKLRYFQGVETERFQRGVKPMCQQLAPLTLAAAAPPSKGITSRDSVWAAAAFFARLGFSAASSAGVDTTAVAALRFGMSSTTERDVDVYRAATVARATKWSPFLALAPLCGGGSEKTAARSVMYPDRDTNAICRSRSRSRTFSLFDFPIPCLLHAITSGDGPAHGARVNKP